MKKLLTLFAVLLLSACSHSVHMLHVSGFQPNSGLKRGKPIQAMASRNVILMFGSDTLYVERAVQSLMNKCKGGQVVSITSEVMTSHSFLSHTDKLYLKGLCVR